MEDIIWVGAHTSASGGSFNALYEGRVIGASTIQFFTSNQKQWQGRTILAEELKLWEKALQETQIQNIMSHDSYLINLGSPDEELLQKSRNSFRQELERCHLLNVTYLNFHPGASTQGSVEKCLDTIVESLLGMEDLILSGKTKIVLETTAGQGTSVGHTFEQISYIVKGIHHKIPVGVCIDTCHIFVAGYDISTEDGWRKTLDEFDRTIGLNYLCAFHLNDSQKDIGSRVDRHASLGSGKIGLESFRFLMQSPKTRHLPKYLETPEGPPVWKNEISLLKNFAKH